MSIFVFGRVQGVLFRSSAKDKAIALGISGFAKNESNGSVLIEAEGECGALRKFVAWCKQGPPYAEVERVVVVRESSPEGISGFEIE